MSFYAVEERTPATPHVDDRIGALFDTPGACVVRGLYAPAELGPCFRCSKERRPALLAR